MKLVAIMMATLNLYKGKKQEANKIQNMLGYGCLQTIC